MTGSIASSFPSSRGNVEGSSLRGRPRAIAWDPKSPSTLILPETTRISNGEDGSSTSAPEVGGAPMRLNCALSHGGVGCNEHETSALMHLLDAYEAYKLEVGVKDTHSGNDRAWSSMKKVSKSYRKALRDCLISWEESQYEDDGMDKGNVNMDVETEGGTNAEMSAVDSQNIELLKQVYAISQIAETFLLLPPPECALQYYDDTLLIPGAVTADTVRYLRFNHMDDPFSSVASPSIVRDVLDSTQPDMLDGGKVYWKLLETLVLRGCLVEAWGVITRHSLFKRSFHISDNDINNLSEYDIAAREQDREGFLDLRSILLSAPLPGGIDDNNDSQVDMNFDNSPDDIDHETHKLQRQTLLDGVPPQSHKLWEASQIMIKTDTSTDYPVSYNPEAAKSIRQNWLHYVTELPSIKNLKRRIPQLQPILNILTGDIRQTTHQNWAEALCAELIYVNPLIRPKDISVRAERYINEYQTDMEFKEFEQQILQVMKGDAGSVIQLIHTMGGGSGAALNATITYLLCTLFADAQLLPMDFDIRDNCSNILTEFLLSASFSIISSLAPKHCDVGVRLATRLLIPNATPNGDTRVVAAIAENLEHHTPRTDAEVRTLIPLCQPLIQLKSRRVLDGCISLVLSRYRYYIREERPGGAVHWLLVGIQLEKMMFQHPNGDEKEEQESDHQAFHAASVCYRYLVTWCNRTACCVLQSLLETTSELEDDLEQDFSPFYKPGEEIIASIKEDSLEAHANNISQVKFLDLSLGIFRAIKLEPRDYNTAAKNIVSCLEEHVTYEAADEDGVVSCLAPRSTHLNLLRLAQSLLEITEHVDSTIENCKRDKEDSAHADALVENFKRDKVGATSNASIPPFDIHGMQVLMEQLTFLNEFSEIQQAFASERGFLRQMRLSFGRGLMRAFVAENSKKKNFQRNNAHSNGDNDTAATSSVNIHSSSLGAYSLDIQERVVQTMLDI